MTTEYACPCCGQPLDVQTQGCAPKRINGEIVFTSTMLIATCWNAQCERCGFTFTVEGVRK